MKNNLNSRERSESKSFFSIFKGIFMFFWFHSGTFKNKNRLVFHCFSHWVWTAKNRYSFSPQLQFLIIITTISLFFDMFQEQTNGNFACFITSFQNSLANKSRQKWVLKMSECYKITSFLFKIAYFTLEKNSLNSSRIFSWLNTCFKFFFKVQQTSEFFEDFNHSIFSSIMSVKSNNRIRNNR